MTHPFIRTVDDLKFVLERKALIDNWMDRAHALRQTPPPKLVMESQQLDNVLNTVDADPGLQQAALDFYHAKRMFFVQKEAEGMQAREAQAQDYAQERLNRGMDAAASSITQGIPNGEGKVGLTYAQLQEARKGKITTNPEPHERDQFNALVKREGHDPKTFARDWQRAYDAPRGGPTREAFFQKYYPRLDRIERERQFAGLSTEMLAVEMRSRADDRKLEADKDAFKPREHVLSDRDIRRADVAASMTRGENLRSSLDTLSDRVSESSLADQGMRGDIARAFAQVEGQPSIPDAVNATVDLINTANGA